MSRFSTGPIQLELPSSIDYYLETCVHLTILYSIFILGLVVVGPPSTESGLLSALLGAATICLGMVLTIALLLWMAVSARMTTWVSVAIAIVAQTEKNGPDWDDRIKRIALLPGERARVGVPRVITSLIVTLVTTLVASLSQSNTETATVFLLVGFIGIGCSALIVFYDWWLAHVMNRIRHSSAETVAETSANRDPSQYALADLERQLGMPCCTQRWHPSLLVLILLLSLWLSALFFILL